MKNHYTCIDCKERKPIDLNGFTPGYATIGGNKVCYACCAERDRKQMRREGKITLYHDNSELTNWPGTLRIHVMRESVSRHNIAGKRYDVWFRFDGDAWHGTRYGDNTQLVHCKRKRGTK